jgi:hypothetical protein
LKEEALPPTPPLPPIIGRTEKAFGALATAHRVLTTMSERASAQSAQVWLFERN